MSAAIEALDLNDLVGVAYVEGGRDPAIGLDCWGLVAEVARRMGLDVPEVNVALMSARAMRRTFDSEAPNLVAAVDVPASGMVAWSERTAHLGIVTFGGVLHAVEPRSLWSPMSTWLLMFPDTRWYAWQR